MNILIIEQYWFSRFKIFVIIFIAVESKKLFYAKYIYLQWNCPYGLQGYFLS